jgi:hypothetical protein
MRGGWELHANPGEFLLRRGQEVIDQVAVVRGIAANGGRPERCRALGIAELRLVAAEGVGGLMPGVRDFQSGQANPNLAHARWGSLGAKSVGGLLERETGFEPATSTLARSHSTS